MIVGVDHLQCNCTDFASACDALLASGCAEHFRHEGLTSPAVLDPFQREPSPLQDIAYFRASASIALEVTRRPGRDMAASLYQPLASFPPLGCAPTPGSFEEARTLETALSSKGLQAFRWSPFKAIVWCGVPKQPQSFSIRSVLLKARAFQQSLTFWTEGAGLRLETQGTHSDGRSWAMLRLSSPLADNGLNLVLSEAPDTTDAYLDDSGVVSLALLCTAPTRDHDSLLRAGALHWSEPFTLEAGRKLLDLALFRGPSGELVELVTPRSAS